MRVVFFVVGTQGDALPAAALGVALRAAGHEMVVATSHDHRGLIERHGLAWSDLSPSYADEIARADDRVEGRRGIALLRARMREASKCWAGQVRRASEGGGLLIGAGLAMGAVAAAAGEAMRIPSVGAGVMPLTPTRAYPPPVPAPPRTPLPGPLNAGLAWAVRATVWRVCFAAPVARLRRDLGLPPRPRGTPRMLYNFSPHLLPPPPDWPRTHVEVTGPWRLPPSGEAPTDALRAFVETGDKPLAIGFGSMRVGPDERALLSAIVIDAVRRSGRRAVVIRGWGALALDAGLDGQPILVVDAAPFDWLLPHVAALVHHGGAGTTAAAARAGVPQVVVPFVADQFFWAWRLHRLGVAPGALARKTMTGASLASAIEAAIGMSARAASLAADMQGEDGAAAAIAALERWGLLPGR